MSQSPVEVFCCTDVPPAFECKARYALDMLLYPLGMRPRWVGRDALDGMGVYYGSRTAGLPDATVGLSFSEEASRYFAGQEAYDAEDVTWTEWDGETWPVLFRSASNGQPDLVASTFYWLSGWQEFTVRERDQHGRFPFSASLQYQLDTAVRPVVDAYRGLLREQLEAGRIPVQPRAWGGKEWAFCPTVDIDHVRKWRVRRLAGELVGIGLDGRDRESLGERLRIVTEAVRTRLGGADPYIAAIKRIVDETVGRGGKATFFLKAGAYSSHDVPYRLSDPELKDRVDELIGAGFEIGLHPSFHAHTHLGHLRAERGRVEALSRAPLVSVRQHYLRFDGNITPRLQQAADFRIDSTLGFSEQEGFRNGTCLPFRLYDLVADEPLPLWEMPVAAMDAALFNRRMLNAEGACRVTAELMETIRRFGGVCVIIWHNLLWDERDHPGWGEHFLCTLEHAGVGGAYINSLQGALRAWSRE